LIAVFVPMAFFPGSVGIIYRHSRDDGRRYWIFGAAGDVADTRAMRDAAEAGNGGPCPCKQSVFRWFNHGLDTVKGRYAGTVSWSLKRTGRLMLIYAVLLIGLTWAFVRLPGGFLPVDDQGFITTDVQTPSESSFARTEAAVEKVEKYLAQRAGVDTVTFPHRLQLSRSGHQYRAGLHLTEGLVGTTAEGFGRFHRG